MIVKLVKENPRALRMRERIFDREYRIKSSVVTNT